MSKTIIAANPTFIKEKPEEDFLQISEFFYDTIQGENFVGIPAAFLRVQHCILNCIWCDSKEVWRFGNPYMFSEIFDLMDNTNIIEKLKDGQHFAITGGSPLRQQDMLVKFIRSFISNYGFKPYIEIENECTILPSDDMIELVDLWNNSPKLESSGNKKSARYKPDVLKKLNSLKNAWFKFVVTNKDAWDEIQTDFIDTNLIKKEQIVIMPEGATQDELEKTRTMAAELAIEKNVRFTDRLHVTIWDKKTGV